MYALLYSLQVPSNTGHLASINMIILASSHHSGVDEDTVHRGAINLCSSISSSSISTRSSGTIVHREGMTIGGSSRGWRSIPALRDASTDAMALWKEAAPLWPLKSSPALTGQNRLLRPSNRWPRKSNECIDCHYRSQSDSIPCRQIQLRHQTCDPTHVNRWIDSKFPIRLW